MDSMRARDRRTGKKRSKIILPLPLVKTRKLEFFKFWIFRLPHFFRHHRYSNNTMANVGNQQKASSSSPSSTAAAARAAEDYSVAVIASSGGGTATLGHTDPPHFLHAIHYQLRLIGGLTAGSSSRASGGSRGVRGIRQALYVNLDDGKSMDTANEDIDTATLYQIDRAEKDDDDNDDDNVSSSCRIVKRGTLKEVNAHCREEQKKMAHAITNKQVHGLICISCHTDIFKDTLKAAECRNIPVTGSGGTSLSKAASLYNIHLIGNAGGSVATTTYTRAVSYAHAFASYWKLPYQPWKHNEDREGGRGQQGPAVVSVLNACLPSFWGVCLAKYILNQIIIRRTDTVTIAMLKLSIRALEDWALPVACSVIMATAAASNNKTPQHTATSSLIMAAIVASTTCSRSVLGGLLAGWLVSKYTERLLYWCIFHNVPATMTNMLTAGGVGAFFALILQPSTPLLQWFTASIRTWILASVTTMPLSSSISAIISPQLLQLSLGGLWGVLSCYGSKVGYYHAIHLPLILVEMETGDASFLGAIDELTLVLACAGISAGNLVAARVAAMMTTTASNKKKDDNEKKNAALLLSDTDAALCRRALRINLSCGDFIEACYPFMEKSWMINTGGYAGSALSSAWLVYGITTAADVPKSLAYLPLPMSIALADSQWFRFAAASVLAMGIPFLATLLHYVVVRK